mmetsp:Transcript_31454/g.75908  ORF Transcript_31454/g.75908 Transcript_31454/m.75908 type:complete len:92 (-) Transcript_31454:648-923(-)
MGRLRNLPFSLDRISLPPLSISKAEQPSNGLQPSLGRAVEGIDTLMSDGQPLKQYSKAPYLEKVHDPKFQSQQDYCILKRRLVQCKRWKME